MPLFRWCLWGSRSDIHFARVASRPVVACLVTIGLGAGVLGCKDLTGSQTLPAGTPNPSFYNNATGALGMRNAAVFAFVNLLPTYAVETGLLTDELTDLSTITGASQGAQLENGGAVTDPVDERILPELPYSSTTEYGTDNVYEQLQGARTAILQALGQLVTYDSTAQDTAILKPAVDSVLRGELYALYGMDEVMLADLFCSGIPLSTLDFQHDYTYRAGSTTTQVYQDAITKFDTALALSGDSARIQNLARVGQGRAYLELGQAAVAADDVALVPPGFQYTVQAPWGGSSGNTVNSVATVSNNEGGTGLPYLTSGDPRSADTTFSYTVFSTTYTVGFPRKYAAGLSGAYTASVTVADWVEAQLIQAEAALQRGDITTWLNLLNQLRATAPIPGTTQPQSAALPPLTDPGQGSSNPDSARLTLQFQERAEWLYLTGHRQADLRRQLRQYAQYWPDESDAYPSGTYLGLGAGFYGTDVTVPIPGAEYINPLFQGCLNRGP